jgi:hypothetical protein
MADQVLGRILEELRKRALDGGIGPTGAFLTRRVFPNTGRFVAALRNSCGVCETVILFPSRFLTFAGRNVFNCFGLFRLFRAGAIGALAREKPVRDTEALVELAAVGHQR